MKSYYRWIIFEDTVPECGKYERDNLEMLVDRLCGYEMQSEEPALYNETRLTLLSMTLGRAIRIQGKMVVMVRWGDKK